MVDITKVAHNIYMIDNRLYSIPEFGAVYLLNEDKKALVDCGPTTSATVVLEGLRQVGFKPEDIDYIIATHIHLDHAGGAGYLLKQMPKAKLLMHRSGVRHYVDPTKLVMSVKQAQGENAMIINGEMVPVPESRIQVIGEGDVLKLSDRQVLTFMEAPGHAPHELCIYESRHGGVFVGDAVGNFAGKYNVLVPITPPPSFDYDLYINTLKRLMKLNARMIYFAHFGVTTEVQKYLQLTMDKLKARRVIIEQAAREGKLDEAEQRLRTSACAELEPLRTGLKPVYDYWCNVSISMSAAGLMKNYRERFLSESATR